MSFPAGRKDDWVRLPGGRVVHGHIMNSIMRGETAVYQFQIVQLTPAHFRVSLIVRADADRADLEARLVSRFTKTLGDSIKAEVCFVDSIPRTAAGKVRPIISLVGRGEEDAPKAE